MSITDEMANKINAPPGQSWQLFAQKVQSSMETVGNAMLPTFTSMQESADSAITKLAEFTTKNPAVVSSFMYLLLAIGGLMAGMGGLKLLVGGVGAIFTGVSKIFSGFRKGLSLIKDAAFYAKYGLFLLQGALSPLKSGFLTVAGGIKNATLGMLAWVKQGIMSALSALPGLIASVWSFTAALLANPITSSPQAWETLLSESWPLLTATATPLYLPTPHPFQQGRKQNTGNSGYCCRHLKNN